MDANGQEARGLAHGIVGSARVTAFGTSIVAPAASVITALVIVVPYAGFASPLVVLITFVASLCCALSIAEFARRGAVGWLGGHLQQPRPRPDSRFPDRLDDDLRLRAVRPRRYRADQQVRVTPGRR